ncbi:MAG: DMT family transporter [Tenericutes bacterium]|jgi:drug/metabolite transporter (DMT)-like permease|nr:DMT family transporter [Mycoplasmatota bacterium]
MNKWAHLAGISFSIIFGFSFALSKFLMGSITPMGVIAYRFLVAFIFFEALRLTKVVKIKIKLKNSLPIILVALFQPILYFIFETYGVSKTTSAEAGLMIALIPIFVAIFGSIILKEKPKIIQTLFILVSFLGVIIIQIAKPDLNFQADILGFVLLLMAVISAALFNIASRSASRTFKPLEITYFMTLVGMVTFNFIYIIQLSLKQELYRYFNNLIKIEVLFPILYLGILASILGFVLVNYTLSKLPVHVSSIYSNIATIVAVLAGFLLLQEDLGFYHLIGGILIIIGVYGTVRVNYLIKRKRIYDDTTHKSI